MVQTYKIWLAGAALSATMSLMGAAFMPVVADDSAAIQAAVNHPDRSEEERARDAGRKPGEILAFAGVAPGMTVLDINSAGGYYSELLSHTVGEGGKVIAHNGAVYWAFMRKTVPERFTERLTNVEPLNVDSEAVELPENSVDMVFSVLAYHDYFFKHEARTAPEDMPTVLGSIYRALKPGGAFIVIDHRAAAGTGEEMGDKLHRINPDFVKMQMTAAGFKVDSESDVLANPADDVSQSPFRPEFRGKTDRFVIKFVK